MRPLIIHQARLHFRQSLVKLCVQTKVVVVVVVVDDHNNNKIVLF